MITRTCEECGVRGELRREVDYHADFRIVEGRKRVFFPRLCWECKRRYVTTAEMAKKAAARRPTQSRFARTTYG